MAPLYLPVSDGQGGVRGLIGLLSERFFDYSGGSREERDPDPADADRIEEARSALIEAIIQESEDETLMDRYLSGEEIDAKVLIEDLEKAVARGSFYPVLAAAAPHGIGMAELLEVMTQAFPAPGEHPLPAVTTPDGKPVSGLSCDPDGPLVAEVVKTTSDPYVGRISLVRVFSGTLRPDATVHVSGHGRADRGSRRPRPGRADRRADLAARQAAAHDLAVRRRGHLRRGQAGQRGDRRHAVGQGQPAADGAVVQPGAAAAGGHHREVQGGRGQDVAGARTGWWPRTRRCAWR